MGSIELDKKDDQCGILDQFFFKKCMKMKKRLKKAPQTQVILKRNHKTGDAAMKLEKQEGVLSGRKGVKSVLNNPYNVHSWKKSSREACSPSSYGIYGGRCSTLEKLKN